jgi:hypothetical protein
MLTNLTGMVAPYRYYVIHWSGVVWSGMERGMEALVWDLHTRT